MLLRLRLGPRESTARLAAELRAWLLELRASLAARGLFEAGAPAGVLTVGEGLEEAGLDVMRVEDEWRVIPRDEARKRWQAWLKTQTR